MMNLKDRILRKISLDKIASEIYYYLEDTIIEKVIENIDIDDIVEVIVENHQDEIIEECASIARNIIIDELEIETILDNVTEIFGDKLEE